MLFHTKIFCGPSEKQAQVAVQALSPAERTPEVFPGVAATQQSNGFYLVHVSASCMTFGHSFPSPGTGGRPRRAQTTQGVRCFPSPT